VTAYGTAATAVPGSAVPGLNAPVVGLAPTPDGGGYWLVAADGGVFTFGDAGFDGSGAGTTTGGAAAVGLAGRPGGYWVAYGPDPAAEMIPKSPPMPPPASTM